MQQKIISVGVAVLGLLAVTGVSANEHFMEGRYRQAEFRMRHHERGGFSLGVCVGQTLAQQGVTLPAQDSEMDATTQAAFEAAIQSCRAPTTGTSPSPSPSVTASPDPTASQ